MPEIVLISLFFKEFSQLLILFANIMNLQFFYFNLNIAVSAYFGNFNPYQKVTTGIILKNLHLFSFNNHQVTFK